MKLSFLSNLKEDWLGMRYLYLSNEVLYSSLYYNLRMSVIICHCTSVIFCVFNSKDDSYYQLYLRKIKILVPNYQIH